MESTTKIIEINGVKLEIDMRHARVIDNYKVGDNVKVLVRDYDAFKSYLGTIIGFDNFEQTPTIVIAYLKTAYNEATVEFIYYNSKTKDVEICPLNDWDLPVSKQQVLDRFDGLIEKRKAEAAELEMKKAVFLKLFGKYFENEFSSLGVNI